MRLVVRIVAIFALGCCTRSKVAGDSAVTPASQTPSGENEVVAIVNGESITMADLERSAGPQLRDKEREIWELKRGKLEELVIRKLVVAEAKKQNLSEEEYLKQHIGANLVMPTETEAKIFYEQNKDQINEPYEAVKDKILNLLKQEKEQKAGMALFKTLRDVAKIEVRLTEPEVVKVEVEAIGPSKGPEKAPVTIVEFSDFQCPYCQKAAATVQQVIANYAGRVRLVYRQFPLEFHDKAFKAAEASMCADEQGKFWEMHDEMFGNQKRLGVIELKNSAHHLGLDSARFDACIDSGRTAELIKKDLAAGQKAGVSGTPAFFINGRMISGAQPYEAFQDAIEKELKAQPN